MFESSIQIGMVTTNLYKPKTMQFNIKFLLNDNTSATTQDVIQNPSFYQQSFMELYNLSCTIQLCSSSVTWEIEDELPVLVANFFLQSAHKLLIESSAKYDFFEYQGCVHLDLIDDNVCISGDFVEDLIIESKVFKELAIELGKHTVEFLEKLNNSKFQPDIDFVRQVLTQIEK